MGVRHLFATSLLLTATFAAGACRPAELGDEWIQAKPFVREEWLAHWDGRGSMVDDLIANHLEKGMTKSEVGELLGLEIPQDDRHISSDVGAVASRPWARVGGCDLALDSDADGGLDRAYIVDHD